MDKDILSVDNKNEKCDYYWASTSSRSSQYYRRMERSGYELVHTEDNEEAPFADVVGNTYQIDDLVLMRAPKEEVERQRREHEKYLRGIVEENERDIMRLGSDREGVENVSTVAADETPSGKSFYFPDNPISKRKTKREVREDVEKTS